MSAPRLESFDVLVVDDDPDVLDVLALALRSEGATVTTAADGDEAIAQLARKRPDLIVLDMMLPRRSGFLVLEEIQTHDAPPPVIMVTANEGRRHRSYAESLGVAAYLNKPISIERLLDVACEALLK